MSRLFTGLAAGLLFALNAAGQEIPLAPAEFDSLGVEFATPEAVDTATAVTARARVVVPPSADNFVASAVTGLVERVYIGVGDRVTAGQALFSIRSPGFLGLQQQYLEARADAALADAQLERDRQLFDEGIIAGRRLEETRTRATSAASRLAEHTRLLRIAGVRQQDIDRLGAGGALLDSLVVRAPVDGVVLDVMTRAGQSVGSVDVLCRVADLSTLWLDIHVPQEQAGAVAVGAEVDVRESPASRPARVLAIGQAVDPTTQTVPVRAEIVRSTHGLRPGQLVEATILAQDTGDSGGRTMSVPISAVIRSGETAYVFVRSAAGVTATPVTVVSSADRRVVVRGLESDARVAVAGVSALKALWLSSAEAEG
jgi:cobalt-zinc-cadmium efflux system membrane fusion protein